MKTGTAKFKLINKMTGQVIKKGFKNKQQALQWADAHIMWGIPTKVVKA